MHPVILRLLQLLRGGRRARHVVPAVLLGAAAGAVCGWNFTFALLIVAALVINGPLTATLASAVAAWSMTRVSAALMHSLGFFLLEKLGLGAVVDSLGHGPIAALTGWDDYELVGAAAASLCCALPAAHALARRTAHVDQSLAPPERLLRPYWPAITAVGLLVAAVLPQAVGSRLVCNALLSQWSAAVGAPVTADDLSYDLWRGELHLKGLRIYGLHEPGRVAMRIDRLSVRLDPGLLLRGCCHCDEATLSGLTCDAPPEAVGFGAATNEPTVLREDEPRDAAAKQPLDVARYLRGWSDAQRRLSMLGGLVGAVELAADLETQQPAGVRLQGIRRRHKAPLDPLSGRSLPLVQIKRLTLAGLPESWSLGPQAVLELTNVTSRPATSARPAQLAIECPDHHARLSVEFGLNGPERRHELTVSWTDASAASIVDARRAAAAGLDVAYARLTSVRGQGRLTRDRLELPLACEVRGVIPAASSSRFGDVDAAVWHDAVARLGGLRFDATLSGRFADARLQVVPAGMVDQLKHQLRAAGEHALVKAVDSGRFVSEPPLPTVAATTPAPVAPAMPQVAMAPTVVASVPEPVKSTNSPSPAASPIPEPSSMPTPPVAPIVAAPAELTSPHVVTTSATAAATMPPIPTPIVPTAETLSVAPPVNGGPSGPDASMPAVAHELRQPGDVVEPSAGLGEVHWTPDYAAPIVTKPSAVIPATRPQVAATSRGLTNLPPGAPSPRPASPSTRPAPQVAETKPSLWAKVGEWFNPADEPPIALPQPPAPTTAAKPMFPRLRAVFIDEPMPEAPAMATRPSPNERAMSNVPPTAAERAATIPPDTTGPRTTVPATAEKPWYQRMFR